MTWHGNIKWVIKEKKKVSEGWRIRDTLEPMSTVLSPVWLAQCSAEMISFFFQRQKNKRKTCFVLWRKFMVSPPTDDISLNKKCTKDIAGHLFYCVWHTHTVQCVWHCRSPILTNTQSAWKLVSPIRHKHTQHNTRTHGCDTIRLIRIYLLFFFFMLESTCPNNNAIRVFLLHDVTHPIYGNSCV